VGKRLNISQIRAFVLTVGEIDFRNCFIRGRVWGIRGCAWGGMWPMGGSCATALEANARQQQQRVLPTMFHQPCDAEKKEQQQRVLATIQVVSNSSTRRWCK
jgi:hypothetical protein